MKSYSFTGLIIKRRNWGEAGKIITVYTEKLGKINLKVTGVRKLVSKRASSIELFNLVRGQAVTGHGNYDVLTEIAVIHNHSAFKQHLGRINIAYQLCEVIDKITPDSEPHPELYELLIRNLSHIYRLKSDWKTTVNNWLLEILVTLGYWPKEKSFTGDIFTYIESVIQKPLHAHAVLDRLK